MSVLASLLLKYNNAAGVEQQLSYNPEKRNADGITYVCRHGSTGNPDKWSTVQTSVRQPTKTSPVSTARVKMVDPLVEVLPVGSAASIVPRSGYATANIQTFTPRFMNDVQREEFFLRVVAVIRHDVFGKEPIVSGSTAV